MPAVLITAEILDALKPGNQVWDTEVRGFGARRQVNDVVFVFKANLPGTRKQIYITIGRRRRGEWNLREARTKATELRYRITRGEDPTAEKREARRAMSVAELCDAYLTDAADQPIGRAGRPKKATTLAADRSRIDAHIKPLLGSMRVSDVLLADIETFQQRVAKGATAKVRAKGRGASIAGGRGAATRTVGLLGAIFAYAVRHNLRSDNPVRGVVRFGDRKRERRLHAEEYAAIGAAIRAIEGEQPIACAALRFILLTGWRRGEALQLAWTEIDLARRTAILGDTKTGRSMRPLARAAIDVLTSCPQRAGNAHVFPAIAGPGPIGSVRYVLDRIRDRAGLGSDVTLHVFRHSIASIAADLEMGEATIAALLGHAGRSVTSRYIHAADAVILAAADKVANTVLELLGDAKPEPEVVQLRR